MAFPIVALVCHNRGLSARSRFGAPGRENGNNQLRCLPKPARFVALIHPVPQVTIPWPLSCSTDRAFDRVGGSLGTVTPWAGCLGPCISGRDFRTFGGGGTGPGWLWPSPSPRLVNVALLSGVVWTEFELFIPAGRTIIWLAIVVIWVGSALFSIEWDRRHPDQPSPEPSQAAQDTYAEVVEHYLQQNWYETERLVAQLLRRNARDVDARLMLASVLRHTHRFDEAAGQLDRLGRIEGSQKWDREMRRERTLLAQAVAATAETRPDIATRRPNKNKRLEGNWGTGPICRNGPKGATHQLDLSPLSRLDAEQPEAGMYERFTDRARKVMQLANQEAQRFNHEYIGTEHILLGLIKEGSGVAANVLKNLDVDLRKIRLEVEKLVQSGPDMVTMGKLPQTPRAKKVIEYSMEEARNLNHNYVGTEHILLGPAPRAGGRGRPGADEPRAEARRGPRGGAEPAGPRRRRRGVRTRRHGAAPAARRSAAASRRRPPWTASAAT